MPGGLGPRFLLEAAFLVLLALGVGLAGLSPTAIVLVMGIAWVLVALVEWVAWSEGPRYPSPFRSRTGLESADTDATLAGGPAPKASRPRRRWRFWQRPPEAVSDAETEETRERAT